MAEAVAILRRQGIDAAATLLPRQGIGAYAWAADSVWERIDGEPLAERDDAASWRDVGRQLATLHDHARCERDAVLYTRDKRDARPHLHARPPERAAFFARWLDRLERVPAAPARLLHNDIHGLNVLCAPAGATLIDWGDAGWGDPASDLGSIPMHRVPEVLRGYEEVASLGQEVEAQILRVPERWRPWLAQ